MEEISRTPEEADKLADITTIEKALEARFGVSHLTQSYRTEFKTRQQKPGKSLQLLAVDVERFISLVYAECPLDVRESLGDQLFVDAIRDEDTQLSASLMDLMEISASMKYEASKTASKICMHARVHVEPSANNILGLELVVEDVRYKDQGTFTCSAVVDGRETRIQFYLKVY
ncbi:hypothetical protein AVEN_221397-1, partial [Araneus ventricosus]